MFDLARKLMMARELKLEEGEISLLGERVQFIPTKILADLLKTAPNRSEAAKLQYETSKAATFDWFKRTAKKKNLSGDQLVKWEISIFNLAGWGVFKFQLSELLKGRAKFTVENSAVAKTYLKNYGKSKEPVCHLIRGGIAGGANLLDNRDDLEVVEIKCMAQGEPNCIMVLKPRAEFKSDNDGLVKNQVSL